jgi:hypothetical protein
VAWPIELTGTIATSDRLLPQHVWARLLTFENKVGVFPALDDSAPPL